MASKPQPTAPISRHPLFPAAVALWFAALLGLGSLAIRASVLERIVLALHLDLVIPAAAPPLGFTARMLLALALAAGGAVAGFLLARRMANGPAAPVRVRPARERKAATPSTASATGSTDGEDEDLARLEAARQDQPLRRRPLALAEETRPAELHEMAPLPGGRPTILNIGELDPIPSLGATPEPQAPAPAPAPDAPLDIAPVALALDNPVMPAAEPRPQPAQVAPPQPASPALPKAPVKAPAAPPALAPLPLAASAPLDGNAAKRLREAPLEALGVVELVERFALALEGRRSAASGTDGAASAADAPSASRQFDMPPALRTPGLGPVGPDDRSGYPFAKSPLAAPEEPDETELAGDGFSSLLDLKPSIRTVAADPAAMSRPQPVTAPHIPSPAFGNSPAETEQALREALAALQRMSGAA